MQIEEESGPLAVEAVSVGSGNKNNNRYVAPDFKRRQLIFDSFARLKRSNSNDQKGGQIGPTGTLLYTWGAGYHGQLGLSSYRKKCKLAPALIDFKESVLQVSCGGFHTAVVTDVGRVYTWGDGRYGQLGNLARKHNMLATPHIVETLEEVTVVQLSCGTYHTACVSDRGDVYSWGSGKYGQLGHGTRLDERYPRKLEFDSSVGGVCQVACGDRHSAVVTRRGRVLTFGSGQHGQLGHGNGLDQLKPKVVEALLGQQVISVATGATFTCAITDTLKLLLWGFGEGLHPTEMTNIVDTPREVHLPERVRQVACGQSHVLILSERGDVYSIGGGIMGQLGHGAKVNVRVPRLVLRGKEIQDISAGRYHSMAVSAYGVLYSWGCGESGQLAHNSLESELFPRIVESLLPNVVGQIACGEHHSFCLASIEHASVSQDVLNWKMIEDEELKLKKNLVKEHSNGLKTKHVLMVEVERLRIIKEITESMRKVKESEQKHLEEQLESIESWESLIKQVKEQIEQQQELAIFANQDNSNSSPSPPHSKAVSSLAPPALNRDKSSRLSGVKSLPVLGANKASLPPKKAESKVRPGVTIAEEEPEVSPATGVTAQPVEKGKEPFSGADKVNKKLPQVASAQQLRPQTSPSPAWMERAGLQNNAAYQNGPVPFQPVMPRLMFIEKTASTLTKVKKFVQEGGFQPAHVSNKQLLELQNQYNDCVSEAKAKSETLVHLQNTFEFLKPTVEDKKNQDAFQARTKELNMKLVTLNTRLVEADENKKNYELYIIRMKEEDVQLSKQTDHLRHLALEYDRLLSKMEKLNGNISSQKTQIDEETIKFLKDLADFRKFADEQLVRTQQYIASTKKQQQAQKRIALLRENRLNDMHRKRLEKLQNKYEQSAKAASEITMQLSGWTERAEFYEERFRSIAAATGLSSPQDINNKFFYNYEITEDLRRELGAKRMQKEELAIRKERLEKERDALSGQFVTNKWRDVDSLYAKAHDEQQRLDRVKEETERTQQRLAVVNEGVNALISVISESLGDKEREKEGKDKDQSSLWAITLLDKKLNMFMNAINKGKIRSKAVDNKKERERDMERAAAAAAAMAISINQSTDMEPANADD